MRLMFHPSPLAYMAAAIISIAPPAANAQAPAGSPAPKTAVPPGGSRSSLPETALVQAREAEQHLAANRSDQAVEILRRLDREHPGQAALSLRLAEIHDTNNQYGAALFYYRRYVKLAGDRARDIAADRVSTLELMVGIDAEAENLAKELGEATRPVATPVSKVERVIAAEAKDGSRVPLRSAADVERIEKQGYVAPLPKQTQTPEITPAHTPILLPDNLSRSTSAAPSSPTDGLPVSSANSSATAPPRPDVKSRPTPTPKPDADALLAQAFSRTADPQSIASQEPVSADEPISTPAPTPRLTPRAELVTTPPPLRLEPQETVSAAKTPRPPVTVRATIASPGATPPVAFTNPNLNPESPRAESFFRVSNVAGNQARVTVMNDMTGAVLTVSIVPLDDGEVLSAILMPGESKTLYIKPDKYQLTANVATTDYSPITLMNTQFEYSFVAGRQYTRRFNPTNVQQLN